MKTSIIIPVYNEQGRLKAVLNGLQEYHEVLVVDDGSSVPVDSYINKDNHPNLTIIRNTQNIGYLKSIKHAIAMATGDVIVTMDGDGEHKPKDIPRMLELINTNKCDIIFGKRPNIARPSEKMLLQIARIFTGEKVKDSGTGFRAIRAIQAKKLEFNGLCTCGLLLVEAHSKRMRICEVEVDLPKTNKPRRIAWEHFFQLYFLIKYILRNYLGSNH